MPNLRQVIRGTTASAIPDCIPGQLLLSSDRHRWDGLLVRLFRYHPTEIEFTIPSVSEESIALYLTRPCYLERQFDGRLCRGRAIPGDMSLVPHGQASQWHIEGEPEILYLYLTPALMMRVADEIAGIDASAVRLVDRLAIRDPFVERVGLLLLQELQSGGVAGRLYAESLACALAVHLLREHSNLCKHSLVPKNGLTQYRLREAIAYVNDHLEDSLKLADMAAAAGMSEYYFARSFKQTMGVAPYRYVIQQRVERAKQLLGQKDLAIAEVALQCGFAHQSHLTKHFRQQTGITPKAYREEKSLDWALCE
ncbi:MAG: helix-turn-helix transcriptional regulator [Coleofasciculaceae cyanobacterium SM2_3_26]|nr:helix-turn-helix transcriptional regulator [Coleofasciculaceae cyanobacterium SM2_3_26]